MYNNPQKKLFERIHNDFSQHYNEKYAQKYRELFLYKFLFKGLNLNLKKVAELACG